MTERARKQKYFSSKYYWCIIDELSQVDNERYFELVGPD